MHPYGLAMQYWSTTIDGAGNSSQSSATYSSHMHRGLEAKTTWKTTQMLSWWIIKQPSYSVQMHWMEYLIKRLPVWTFPTGFSSFLVFKSPISSILSWHPFMYQILVNSNSYLQCILSISFSITVVHPVSCALGLAQEIILFLVYFLIWLIFAMI